MTVTEVAELSRCTGMWTVATRKCHDIEREDRKWGCVTDEIGVIGVFTIMTRISLCVWGRDQISSHHIILRAPLSTDKGSVTLTIHTHHISYSEYFSRVPGPPEMKTYPIILTTPVFTIKYCHKSAGNIILGISNDNYRLNVRNKWVVTPPRLSRASWCPGVSSLAVTRESQCQRYLTLARVKLTLDICNLSQLSHVTKYQH